MATEPFDTRKAYDTLYEGLRSYTGELSPLHQTWLKNAVAEAAQEASAPHKGTDRLFSDPIRVAQVLIEERQSLPIIIASLIYSRIKKEQLSSDAYHKKLDDIGHRYSDEIKNYTRFALQEAYTDMPKMTPVLARKFRASEQKRKDHFVISRHTGVKAKPQKTEEEKWVTTFIRYMASRNPLPQSQAIRIADRWVLLQDIDPENPTPEQKARIRESWCIHAQMANNHGLRRFYYDFGNLYVRTHFPETYRAITQSLEVMAQAISAEENPLREVTDYLANEMEAVGLKRATSVDDVKDGYYIKVRDKKSVISIWTKLIADGIDPEDYFKAHADTIKGDDTARTKVLIENVIKGQLFDIFAFTVIVDEKALVEKKIIAPDDPHKPWRVHREACEWIAGLVNMGIALGPELVSYVDLPHRDKDYFAHPRGQRAYRSRQKGIAKRVGIPSLGIDEIDVPIEIIVRTPLVHFEAEYGKWAHNRFKSELIRGAAAWEDAAPEFSQRNKVYLFTPDGEILEFDKGATIRDVAFQINHDFGLYCTDASIFSGYESWRRNDMHVMTALGTRDPDALIDDIDGCTIIINAEIPASVTQMRAQGIKGYDRMPPGYSGDTLRVLGDKVRTNLAQRKIDAIISHVRL